MEIPDPIVNVGSRSLRMIKKLKLKVFDYD